MIASYRMENDVMLGKQIARQLFRTEFTLNLSPQQLSVMVRLFSRMETLTDHQCALALEGIDQIFLDLSNGKFQNIIPQKSPDWGYAGSVSSIIPKKKKGINASHKKKSKS